MNTAFDQQPAMSLPIRSAPRKGLFALYCGVSLFAIFYLPYFFPVAPSTSDSYLFGYNNTIGILLLMLFVAIGAIWTKGLNFNFNPTGPSTKVPLKYLWLSLVIEFAACAGMYLCAGRYGIFGEDELQINRIWRLSLGKKPYVDFQWPFGPLPLYFPKWFSDSLHLGIVQGYFLFWLLYSLIGVILLYATINMVDFPTRRKTGIYFLLFTYAVGSVLNMGSNYTWVRYLCPLFFILVVYGLSKRRSELNSKLAAAALAIMFTAALMMISPEVTIAHAFACIVLLFPRNRLSRNYREIAVYLATLTGFVLLFAFGIKAHFLDVILGDAKGGNSFPIIIDLANVFLFVIVFVCACYLVKRSSNDHIQDNTIALIIFAIPMLAAALGRSDPGHVLMNGMGFFIAAFFYASNFSSSWKLFRNTFIVCYFLIPVYGIYLALFALTRRTSPDFPFNSNISALYPQSANFGGDGVFEAPFGYLPTARGFFFSPQIDFGFYDGLWDADAPKAYYRKMSELAQHPQRSVLVPYQLSGDCSVNGASERGFISLLFGFPYTASVVHPESIRKPLCDYIVAHYTLAVPASPQNFQYELWKPKM